ncbi:chaplin family protein [Streptomyces sp. MMG1121]|uniref:chaplin family protein n=1 Tax=Streptomyces sp. MMG1121 TaxID=1415544 RepID=UPI00099DC930|nr:chaplin family protein [Streptomyces sp. MMG1121]
MRVRTAIAGIALAAAATVGMAGIAAADTGPDGIAIQSPGVAAGNNVQVPVQVPVNPCGAGIGALTPTHGNFCVNK